MPKVEMFEIIHGPFAKTRKSMDAFCHNLFLARAMDECAIRLVEITREYEGAVAAKDDDLAAQKSREMDAYQSSLQLTAHMFSAVDEIDT